MKVFFLPTIPIFLLQDSMVNKQMLSYSRIDPSFMVTHSGVYSYSQVSGQRPMPLIATMAANRKAKTTVNFVENIFLGALD